MSMTINSIASNKMQDKMQRIGQQLATGKKINSAADNAAGLAIAEKLTSQINGLDKGTDNTYDMRNLVTTAEGGLSTISDSLQRVRELSIQASSDVLTADDKTLIQNEIQSTLQGINDIAGSVQFNGQNLLDGTFQNKNTASDANGRGMSVSIGDMSVNALGLGNYNVTTAFNISDVDNAIAGVSNLRADLGSTVNRLSSTAASNAISELNLAAARSRMTDADMAKSVMDYKKSAVLNEASMLMQKNTMNQMTSKVSLLG